jgi:Family of unknown function (DUF5808)
MAGAERAATGAQARPINTRVAASRGGLKQMPFKTKNIRAAHMRRRRSGMRSLMMMVGIGLLGASIIRELRLPPSERTWHGLVFGRVPYDLRPPTFDRVVNAIWQPDSGRLFTPTALGVGWSVNLAALARPLGHSPS